MTYLTPTQKSATKILLKYEFLPESRLDPPDGVVAAHLAVGLLAEGEHLPEDDAVAPDVGLEGEAAVGEELERHPLPGDVHAGVLLVADVVVHGLGQAEIGHLGHEVLVEEDVPGGEVTVHDAFRGQVFHTFGDSVRPPDK